MTGYLGSKQVSGAYQAVIANMPPHDTYIETHLARLIHEPAALGRAGFDVSVAA